jgi:uncharacterized protein (DUF433 family)
MVKFSEPEKMFGIGLYTPREAAWLARVRTQTFNRWFFGDAHGSRVLDPRLESSPGDRVVTFWDLIQAVAVRTLRANVHGARLSLQHIRTVIKSAERDYSIKYPLARKHTLYVYSNRLILRIGDEYIGIEPGVDKDQLYHHKIIAPFLEELEFDHDKMADQWTPLRSENYYISLDANRRFGMPIVEPSGLLVESLTDAVDAEGSIEAAADAFEVETEAVNLAVKYRYDYLPPAA